MARVQRITFTCWPWEHWLADRPDNIALMDEKTPITWRQLCDDISQAQSQLPAVSSSYLAIISDNHYATLITMLAAWQGGLKTLLLNADFSPQERQEIMRRAGIEHLLSEPINFTPSKEKVFSVRYNELASLTLTLTSGSTGTPKAVVHSAKNHLASATGLFSILPFEKTQVWLLSLPLFHISGLAIVWRWLAKGATLKIANTKGAALFTALEDVTHASMVPTQLQRILNTQKPPCLQRVLLGGAQIPTALVNEAERQGIQCWCGYGMTEMASTMTAKRADGRDCVGSALPFRQLKLSSSGEVLVKGETLALGYFLAGQLVPLCATFGQKKGEDWFATKDLAHWQEDDKREQKSRKLQLQGRLDNMFICGGEKVQPETLEKKLSHYAGISQLIILPFADDIWGHVPVAIIEGNVDLDKFLRWAKSQLPPYQRPKYAFILPDKFARSGIKISRTKLAAWLKTKMPKVIELCDSAL